MSFSIRTKLLGGFGLVLGLLLISTVLALSALSRVNDEAETLGRRDLAAVESLGAIDASLNAVRAAQMSASTEQTSASTEEFAASAQELARTAERLQELVGRFQLV